MAITPDGSFVVVWEDDNDDNNTFQICAAGFHSSGVKTFGNITVNRDANEQQLRPDVSIDANGNFVVVWQDDLDNNGYHEILGRGLDSEGG